MNQSPTIVAQIMAVDKNSGRVERLKRAVRAYMPESRFSVHSDLKEAERLLLEKEHSLIVLSPEFSEKELKLFVESSRKTFGGGDSAYLMLVETDEQNEETLALGLLAGVNGFLFDPFSVENVDETFELARSLKAESIERRQKEGIRLALKSAKQHIDKIASALRADPKAPRDKKEYKRIQAAIEECDEVNRELYHRILVGSFIWATRHSERSDSNSYIGVSDRVRKITSEKALKQVKDQEK